MMHVKMTSSKYRPFVLDLDELSNSVVPFLSFRLDEWVNILERLNDILKEALNFTICSWIKFQDLRYCTNFSVARPCVTRYCHECSLCILAQYINQDSHFSTIHFKYIWEYDISQKPTTICTKCWSCIIVFVYSFTSQWRHTGHDGVSNHQPHHCLLNRLFRRTPKKISKLRVTGLCVGNWPVTSEFPAQMASKAEKVSIWWRHHVNNMRAY